MLRTQSHPHIPCAAYLTFWLSIALTGDFTQAQVAPHHTGREVAQKIQQAVGVAAPAGTVDTFKAGDPETPVTGIVTTFLATYDVLKKAAASGNNLIITHEPTYYNHLDDTAPFKEDAVLAEKRAFIRDHHLMIWRFHDLWHMHSPDGIVEGFTHTVGWDKYRSPQEPMVYRIPAITLARLATEMRAKFGSRLIRVVGDPAMMLTRVGYRPGASGEEKQVKMLERNDVEVLIAGESHEWETVEYVRDAVSQGRHKALILLGHEVSEEAGMDYCASWLRRLLPGMRVEFVSAGEPFWAP